MKVYLAYSRRLSEKFKYKIITYLKKNNFSINERERVTTFTEITETKNIFERNVRNIKSSDIFIAELSYASSGLGYEISLALEWKKPIIALYNMTENLDDERHIKAVPANFRGNTSKYFILKSYSPDNIEEVLNTSSKIAKTLFGSKFNLFINPELDQYLEWCIKERKKTKSEITRESLQFTMKSDEQYQNYLTLLIKSQSKQKKL